MARDACSRDAALARIRAQRPLTDKLRVADYIIDNGGDMEATRAQLQHILLALTPPPAA
jgi:dephospho-CoA kinase